MKRSRLLVASLLGAALAALAGLALGQPAPPTSASAAPSASTSASAPAASALPAAPAPASADPGADGGVDDGGNVYASCVEHIPEGASRPRLVEKFPTVGLAGYALPLEVWIEHGAGETVLPQGFSLQSRGVEAEALQKSGFMVPSPDGGAPPSLAPMSADGGARTRVVVQVVALPKSAGRHEMVLPPLPLAVSRASGELMTLCTSAHRVVIDDPTGNTPDARPRPNPPARRQPEHWEALERGVQLGLVALVAAIAGALLYRWWRRRPRPVPPPPPPRPAWEVALEALEALRAGKLLEEGRGSEYVDAISDILRRYLGERFGFDGLEATTREIRKSLRAVVPPPPVLPEIERLLDESDLIKFARVTPTREECEALFALGETIVKETIPARPALADAPAKEGA
ncbi:MAG: hypothetical protein MUF64_09675 [Polyangiaceae bacterium]|jgi:hypothetical protein|nr:hypothetical protein [Polyangiaceae bacterium]